MIIRLKRFSYSRTETEGVLVMPNGELLNTIEQPWVPNPNGAKGGKPFHSCIPDGIYRLLPWKRPSGALVWLMFNPELGVHKLPSDHTFGYERDLCLWHVANFVTDIQGCVGPGRGRVIMRNRKTGNYELSVASSSAAMRILEQHLGRSEHILSIEPTKGARDGG